MGVLYTSALNNNRIIYYYYNKRVDGVKSRGRTSNIILYRGVFVVRVYNIICYYILCIVPYGQHNNIAQRTI